MAWEGAWEGVWEGVCEGGAVGLMRVLVKGTTEARLGLAAPAELLVGAWTLLVDGVPFERGMAIRSRADFLHATGTKSDPNPCRLRGSAHTTV